MKIRVAIVCLLLALPAGAAGEPPASEEEEVLALTRELLENIYLHPNPDFYAAHALPELTAFEGGPRIEGLDMHLFALGQFAELVEAARASGEKVAGHLELLNPKVQLYGDTAIVTFTSGVWRMQGEEFSAEFLNETRVWVRRGGAWKLAHFHKSAPNSPAN